MTPSAEPPTKHGVWKSAGRRWIVDRGLEYPAGSGWRWPRVRLWIPPPHYQDAWGQQPARGSVFRWMPNWACGTGKGWSIRKSELLYMRPRCAHRGADAPRQFWTWPNRGCPKKQALWPKISKCRDRRCRWAMGRLALPFVPIGPFRFWDARRRPILTWDDRPMRAGEATFFEIAGVHRRYHCPQSRTLFFGSVPDSILACRRAGAVCYGSGPVRNAIHGARAEDVWPTLFTRR